MSRAPDAAPDDDGPATGRGTDADLHYEEVPGIDVVEGELMPREPRTEP